MSLRPSIGALRLVFLVSLFFVLSGNQAFWHKVLTFFEPQRWQEWAMLGSMLLVTTTLLTLLLSLFAWPRLLKPVLITLLLLHAGAAYFMNSYGIYIDRDMVQNVFETNPAEAFELFNLKLLAYLLGLGVLPAALLWRTEIRYARLPRALLQRLGMVLLSLGVIGANAAVFYDDYVSWGREQKETRRLFTPLNVLYATGDYINRSWFRKPSVLEPVGLDAKRQTAKADKPLLLVVVVGETARAANFGLNGYSRDTTPQLRQLDVINFPQASSCGTATATSVPCMFSPMSREEYKSSQHKESLLDVVQRAGVPVLWRDNNSGCKGACDRVPYEDLSNAKDPQLCQGNECYDEILLKGLAERLQRQPGNLLLVLHQKGSHGPAYYLRYPQAFEQFKPVCRTNKLQECDRQSIVNAYDNTLLYTDHFLASTIRLLQQQSGYRSALWYMSDHGESLGENNLYLHGAPYAFAPETQTHIPMVQWISPQFAASTGLNVDCLRQQAQQPISHDNLFHSVLGILDIQTQVYQPGLDIFRRCRGG